MSDIKRVHDESFALNQARWNEVVAIHVASPFYRVKEFLAGEDILCAIEATEVGDVRGKSLIHLQCHFGLDTLALARRGARVTGLDFSENAIAAARDLAEQPGIEACFVVGNLYDAPTLIDERFDRAYVSWGAINWLPDIKGWARVVADMLKPGGEVYLLEGHPFAFTLDQLGDKPYTLGISAKELDPNAPLRPTYSYFHNNDEPLVFEMEQTYTGDGPELTNKHTHEFVHSIGDILTGLIEAGLTISQYREHDRLAWQMWSFLMEDGERMYRLEHHINLPVRRPTHLGPWKQEGDEPTAAVLRGVGASPGVARGPAQVFQQLNALPEHLPEGCVLVLPCLDPAWTPVLRHVAGLVIERGGLLSHAAIIAREYGIPLVIGVPEATERIMTGAMIGVDGDSGTIQYRLTPPA